jgi:hypothetical protein
MKVYTYYEDLNWEEQNGLLNLWTTSWKQNGFEPIILSQENAKLHPFYETYINELKKLSVSICNKELHQYGLACWLRWLAYATQPEEKFYVSDYDVINHSFSPIEPNDELHFLNGCCPCAASGTAKQFETLCYNFIEFSKNNLENIRGIFIKNNFVWFHDQDLILAQHFLKYQPYKMTNDRKTLFGFTGEGEFWKRQLVHHAGSSCVFYCKQNNLTYNRTERLNIATKYFKLATT